MLAEGFRNECIKTRRIHLFESIQTVSHIVVFYVDVGFLARQFPFFSHEMRCINEIVIATVTFRVSRIKVFWEAPGAISSQFLQRKIPSDSVDVRFEKSWKFDAKTAFRCPSLYPSFPSDRL
jgi:hypothetical protein